MKKRISHRRYGLISTLLIGTILWLSGSILKKDASDLGWTSKSVPDRVFTIPSALVESQDVIRAWEPWKTSDDAMADAVYIAQIHQLPRSEEKRVISYGLYGDNPKYTHGAIQNAQLVSTYYPGWVARFYVDSSVPGPVIGRLNKLGAEVIAIKAGDKLAVPANGEIAGMFWRFMVADDPTVDRFIVRDADSRLNARERIAVEEWIRSGHSTHSIRDHTWHYHPMMGGMWGSVKGAIKNMSILIESWSGRSHYGEDMDFLNQVIWPLVQHDQISHDAYYCERYENAHPFPTKRYDSFQHVGQVFDSFDRPDPNHTEMLRGTESPLKCRKLLEWRHG